MKIYVLSAGKSITDGRDYHWNDDIIPEGIEPMQAMLNEQSGKYYSLVIAKGPGSGYSVFLARLPLVSGARDDLGRPICAGFLIQELSNEEARKLAIEYVKDKAHLAQILCSPSVIKTAADFEVDLEAAEKAVRELLSGELPDGSTPVTCGELWGESSAWERREELLGWLKNNRLSDRPGNRVILCYFTDPERLSGEEDLVLHYSDPPYTKKIPKPSSGGCPLNNPWMQVLLGTIVAALLILGIAKSCSSSPHSEAPAEPAPKATDVPTPKPADVPATEPTDKPATEPTDKPATEPTDKPATEPTDKPATEPTDKPATVPTDAPHTADEQGETHLRTTEENTPTE